MGKTFVRVTAEHDESGHIKPLLLTWTDGRRFEIDRVLDVRQAAGIEGWRARDSLYLPGQGQRVLPVL